MSGGNNKAFLANPQNWLSNHLLVVKIQEPFNGGARYMSGTVVTVDLHTDPDNSAQDSAGNAIPCLCVTRATGGGSLFSHRFPAFYLPFRSNDIRTMQLSAAQNNGNDAAVFFTDTLNGCSVAVGPGANPKIGHFNRTVGGDDAAGIDQGAIDNDINNEFAGGTQHEVRRGDYKAGAADYATFVGVRVNGVWTFYWQRMTWVGGGRSKVGKGFQLAAGMPTVVP